MHDFRQGLHLRPMSSKRTDSPPPRKKQAAKRRRRPAGKTSRKEEAADGLGPHDSGAATPTREQAAEDKAPTNQDEAKMTEAPPRVARTNDSAPSPADSETRGEPEKARSRRATGGGRSERGQARAGASSGPGNPHASGSGKRQAVEIDLELLDSRAWDIFRNELQEVGGVLINDTEAGEIATRSFTLARIFLIEKARQEARAASR